MKKTKNLYVACTFLVMLVSAKVVANNPPAEPNQQSSTNEQKLPAYSRITFEPATNNLLRGLMVIESNGNLIYQDYAYSDAVNKMLSQAQQKSITDCLEQTVSFWKIPANHNNPESFYWNQTNALQQKAIEGDFTYHVSDANSYSVLLPKENADAKKISACFKKLLDPIITAIDAKNQPGERKSAVLRQKSRKQK